MNAVSVIMPLYNKEPYIARALRSVLSQTVSPGEIIVVNDGSTDGSEDVVKQTGGRIVLINQSNSGVSSARNRGVKEAHGDLIAFLDADDEWKPSFLETVTSLAEAYPRCGAYTTNYEIVLGKKTRLPLFKGLPPFPWAGLIDRYFFVAASGEPPITASSCCVPKDVFVEMGGFREGKRMGEDVDLWGRIALRYPLAFSSVVGASYHHDVEMRACLTFNNDDEHPFCDTVSRLRDKEIDPDVVDDLSLYVSRLKVENMRQHVLAGNFRRARELNSEVTTASFGFRRLLWGGSINFLAGLMWHAWYDRNRHG